MSDNLTKEQRRKQRKKEAKKKKKLENVRHVEDLFLPTDEICYSNNLPIVLFDFITCVKQ